MEEHKVGNTNNNNNNNDNDNNNASSSNVAETSGFGKEDEDMFCSDF